MSGSPAILLIGQQGELRAACESLLQDNHLRVRVANPPSRGRQSGQTLRPSLCIVVCERTEMAESEVRRYRQRWLDVPLLVVDGTPGGERTVELLQAGADDVLPPAKIQPQLLARARALYRRYSSSALSRQKIPLIAGDLRIDFGTHKVWVCDNEVSLSPTEFRILRTLSMHAGKVVPHNEMVRSVWGELRSDMGETLRVYIRHLRRKIQPCCGSVTIVTRPGIGYMLAAS